MVLPGFNTDFKYHGETYHVQTEDNGVGNPMVVTLLYFKGAILASRKTSYRDLLVKPAFQKELMDLMKTQHKEIMRDLLAGKYDRNLGRTEAATSPAAASLPVAASGIAAAPGRAASAPETLAPAVIPTLDQAIMRYLEECAASAARGAGLALH